ncbi:MAG: DUF3089 domain-containing protein [Candidatus Avilachnospira sp.]|jgi:hypothetical protein
MKKNIKHIALGLLLMTALAGCNRNTAEKTTVAYSETAAASEAEGEAFDAPDYSLSENWAYLGEGPEAASADVFFICPTVFGGDEDVFNMSLSDEEAKASFLGATNMEKGIYDEDSRFFAPYYRQAGLNVYELTAEEREPWLQFAYEDISLAFDYYLEHENEGQPIILAGFSQGADLCIRLLKDKFEDPELQEKLIACYAIGWSISDKELSEYPWLQFASSKDDTGVIIAFNSEAESVNDSMMIPAGTRSLCINPLNWATDSTPADKSLNLGACFTDYDGNITEEIPELTRAYIDPERGALKVPDVTPKDYPAGLYIFEDGIYHLYDYQFFYRNLQENVADRIAAYMEEEASEDAA